MKNLKDIEDMSLNEYLLRMQAYELQQADRLEELHLQAWLNRIVGSEIEVGNSYEYRFKTYEQFFNKKDIVENILGVDEKERERIEKEKEKARAREKEFKRLMIIANGGKE